MLLFALPACVNCQVPAGTFQTRCLERHFWLSVNSAFLGLETRFDFEDQSGLHMLSDQEATLCGYSVLMDEDGDLVFRASFLACHVQEVGTDFHLRLWFVKLQVDGKLVASPLQLHCSLQPTWSPREMVCEENYMEVSLQNLILLNTSRGQTQKVDGTDLAVMFTRAGWWEGASVFSLSKAAALGYHISVKGSRIVLRCPYFSPFSYVKKERGVDLEIVKAVIMSRVRSSFLALDVTVACALNLATADGSHLLWTVPYIRPVLVHGEFRDRGVTIGVEGRALTKSEFKERGFKMELQEGRVEVRIPLGAKGGRIKSGLVRGKYSQAMSVDVFFMSQFEDDRWPLTQLRSFRLVKTPLIPQSPALTNNTVDSEGLFSITLGIFAADVSLLKVTVDGGGDFLTWKQNNQTQKDAELTLSRLSHSNGSHSYSIHFPLSHPKIIPAFIGGGFETYSFSFIFTLIISQGGEEFSHQAKVEQSIDRKAQASPRLDGKCTESSLLVFLHHGTQADLEWELFIGSRKLDWELVETGRMEVEAETDYLIVEIPYNSPVMEFEEVTLQGFVSGVRVSLVDAESLKMEDSLVHKCTFPARELLLCLPEGRVVAVVDTTHTIPPTQPNQTSLSDPDCVATATDSARALFSFSVDSCGTTVTTEGNVLVYENLIRYHPDYWPAEDAVIHRESTYRLTIQCRFPVNENRTLTFHQTWNSSLNLSLRRTRRDAEHAGESKWSLDGWQHCNQVWILWTFVSLLLLMLCRFLSASLPEY